MEVLSNNLDEAIDILKTFFKNDISKIEKMTEDEFIGSSHFGGGMFIRNSWQLWWHKGHNYKEWNQTQPLLNAWFETMGIVHADDMSAIILTCLYRNITGKDYEIEKQVETYISHWKEQGYSDGIPRSK